MPLARSLPAGCAALLVSCAMAATGSGWKTVTVGGGVSVDVPTAVGKAYQPEADNKNGLAHISTMLDKSTRMDCDLDHGPYTSNMTQDGVADKITSSPGILCQPIAGATGFKTLDSHATTSNGLKAGSCTSASTLKEKLPGWVISAMIVAAPDGYYTLTCGFGTTTQAMAEAKWKTAWSARVAHIRGSLHLPQAK
jgi:hypothetical protein